MAHIKTTFRGATNTRGAHILAEHKSPTGKRTTARVAYAYELSSYECHVKAAKYLARTLSLVGHWYEEELEHGYMFVRIADEKAFSVWEGE